MLEYDLDAFLEVRRGEIFIEVTGLRIRRPFDQEAINRTDRARG